MTLAFCWAHVRRKFLDIHKTTKSVKAMEIVALINEMYEIAARLNGQPAEARLAVRQAETAPRIAHLLQTFETLSGQIAMKSTLGVRHACAVALPERTVRNRVVERG